MKGRFKYFISISVEVITCATGQRVFRNTLGKRSVRNSSRPKLQKIRRYLPAGRSAADSSTAGKGMSFAPADQNGPGLLQVGNPYSSAHNSS